MNDKPESRESREYPPSLNGGQPQDDNEVRLGEEHRRPLDPGRPDRAAGDAPAAPVPRSTDDRRP